MTVGTNSFCWCSIRGHFPGHKKIPGHPRFPGRLTTVSLLFSNTEKDDKVAQDKQIKKYILQHKGLIIIS